MADLWKIAFALDCHRKSLELRAKAKSFGSPHAAITASASSTAPSPPFSQWSDTANLAPALSAISLTRARSAGVSV